MHFKFKKKFQDFQCSLRLLDPTVCVKNIGLNIGYIFLNYFFLGKNMDCHILKRTGQPASQQHFIMIYINL